MRITTILLAALFGLPACSSGSARSNPVPAHPKDGAGSDAAGDDVPLPDTTASDTTPPDANPPEEDAPAPVGCAAAKDGDPCDDENACTTGTTCQAGVCAGGTTVLCDEDTACTKNVCVPATGCMASAQPDGAGCSSPCFGKATCQAGVCVSDPTSKTVCPAPTDPCVDALQCNSATGLCDLPIAKPDGASCDSDDDACTIEACGGGACTLAKTETCDAQQQGNPCWTWQCNKKSGCQQVAFVDGNSCDDGNKCTSSDTCTTNGLGQKLCIGTPLAIDDSNACTSDACAGGVVTHDKLTGTSCGFGMTCQDGECVASGCQPACGECQACDGQKCVDKAGGIACSSDQNECTVDQCQGGSCAHTDAIDGTVCGGGSCQGGSCQAAGCSPACDECHTCGGTKCNPKADGTTCSAGTCQGGTCTAMEDPSLLADGLDSPHDLALDADWVYWVEDSFPGPGSLRRVKKTGGNVETLATTLSEPSAVAVDESYAYVVERNNGKDGAVRRVAKGGGPVQTVATGLQNSQNHMRLDASYVYWGDYVGTWPNSSGAFKRATKAENGVVTVLVKDNGLANLHTALDLDGSYLYFTNDYDKVLRVSKSGGDVTATELASGASASSLRVYGGWIFITEYGEGKVVKVPVGGGGITTIATNTDSAADLAVEDGWVYWIEDTNPGNVWRSDWDGNNKKNYSKQANTLGLELDATHVYWAVSVYINKGKIMRSPK